MAGCLQDQGKWADAAAAYEAAVLGREFGRLSASISGFDRAQFEAKQLSPRAGLAAMLDWASPQPPGNRRKAIWAAVYSTICFGPGRTGQHEPFVVGCIVRPDADK